MSMIALSLLSIDLMDSPPAVWAILAVLRSRSRMRDRVWEREKIYWNLLKDADLKSFLKLFHPLFVSWPCESKLPSDRSALCSVLEGLRRSYTLVSYELDPLSVQVFDRVAIVHYTVSYTLESEGEEFTECRRMSHTWIEEKGEWLIAGGMSGEMKRSTDQ